MASMFSLKYIRSGSAQAASFAILATLMAAGCSSSDSVTPANDPITIDPDGDDRPGLAIEGLNGTPADQLASPWLANMSFFRIDSETPGTGDAFAELSQYDADFKVSSHIEFYTPELDTCDIRDLEGGDGGGGDDNRPADASGGQTLTLNTPSGPWFELEQKEGSIGTYETDNGLPGAFPGGLTLSIPGDDFPNVAAYPLAEPSPAIRILPASDVLTMADVTAPFTWIPGEQVPGSYMELVGIAFDAAGEFVGFPIFCNVVDDGSFTMPQEVVDAFAATDLTIRTRFQRSINRIDFLDGIVFHQNSRVAE